MCNSQVVLSALSSVQGPYCCPGKGTPGLTTPHPGQRETESTVAETKRLNNLIFNIFKTKKAVIGTNRAIDQVLSSLNQTELVLQHLLSASASGQH